MAAARAQLERLELALDELDARAARGGGQRRLQHAVLGDHARGRARPSPRHRTPARRRHAAARPRATPACVRKARRARRGNVRPGIDGAQDPFAGARQREHAQVHGQLREIGTARAACGDRRPRCAPVRCPLVWRAAARWRGRWAPRPTTATSTLGGHSSGRPRARRGMRPAKPQLTRDSARLAAGLRSNSSKPKLRTRPRPGRSLPKSFTRPSVKRVTPWRSSARHAAEARQQLGEIRVADGGACQHLGERGRVAQAQVETLAGHRVQRLRGIADEHHAPGHGFRGARQREWIRYCAGRSRVQRPARQPNAASSSAANAVSSSAMSSAARARPHRPDHGVAAARHRQHRQRTRGA